MEKSKNNLIYQKVQILISNLFYYWNILLYKIFGTNKKEKNPSGLKQVKDIPGPRPLPIFGTTLTSKAFREPNLHKANQERMRLYGAIVKEEHLWGFPMIHLLSPDYIETATKSFGTIRPHLEIQTCFRKSKPERYDSVGISNTQGEEWENLYSVLHPLMFSTQYIIGLTNESNKMGADFINCLRAMGPSIPNFGDICRKYVAETAFYNAFGTRVGFIQEDDEKIPESMKTFLQFHDKFWIALHRSSMGFPWRKYLSTKLWLSAVKSEDVLLEVVEDLMQKAIKDEKEGGILEGLLESQKISYKTKRLLLLEIIMGSSDSVIYTIVFALYYISKEERVANKLFQEIKKLLPERDSEFRDDFLNKATYLRACIMETFRVSSIAPNLMRVTEQALELGGYHIPCHSLIVTHWGYAALQEESFYKAGEFLPERWIYGEGGVPPFKPHRRQLVNPFGLGKRACPGSRIIKQHLTILLAKIFRNFKVSFDKPLESSYVWIVQPVQPFTINFQEREE